MDGIRVWIKLNNSQNAKMLVLEFSKSPAAPTNIGIVVGQKTQNRFEAVIGGINKEKTNNMISTYGLSDS